MKTVFVGLSGGVDSAVSAALLNEQGYRVVGCFIKIWQPEFTECTWREDRLDAMRVCAALNIPYKEIDLSREYMDEVVRDMIDSYKRGITPNPDVLCNSKIKFGFFARWAFEEGADLVATGHYAQIRATATGYELLRGVDAEKDQSYFLWQLSEKDLSKTLFPVGGLTKRVVRAEAQRLNIPVAHKHDSQGLCFVGDISLPEFLAQYVTLTAGDVIDDGGQVIGVHGGAALYTRGQRHGFSHNKSTPCYVTRVDVSSNTITVSMSAQDATIKNVWLEKTHWVGMEPTWPYVGMAQVRYREAPVRASAEAMGAALEVTFETPCIAAPGQSLVWYEGERLVGGGVISHV